MDELSESRQRDVHKKASELAANFACSYDVALRIVLQCWPAVSLCTAEMVRRSRPSIVALELFAQQREYVDRLRHSMLPLEDTLLPCFRKSELGKKCCGYSTLTWAEVAAYVNDGPGVEIFFNNGNVGIPHNVASYEVFYQLILGEGFTNIVGFVGAVDGIVPLLDYLHARHFGGASLLQSLPSHSPDVAERVDMPRCSSAGNPQHNTLHRTRNLYGNDVSTSVSHRQNKATMQTALAAKGLAHIRGISAHGPVEAQEKMRAASISFPVIVKPVSGAGSEFVSLCRDAGDVDTAFAVCGDAQTMQSTAASHMVLQEYIAGPEYVVNAVSYGGRPVVTDVWRSWKFPAEVLNDRLSPVARHARAATARADPPPPPPPPPPPRERTTALLYDRIEFVHDLAELPADGEERRVVDYTLRCLDALGVRQGCSHCEVRVDERPGSATRGSPVLIELNSRMLGDTPRATSLVGYDQYMLTVYLALCATALPEDKLGTDSESRACLPWPPAPLLYRSFRSSVTRHVVFLRVVENSHICASGIDRMKALPTFRRLTRDNILCLPRKRGNPTPVLMTTDLLSSPGACVLEGREADIRRDTAYIRRVENKDLMEWESLIDAACELETARWDTTTSTSASPGASVHTNGNTLSEKAYRESLKRDAARQKVESYFAGMQEPPLFIRDPLVRKLQKIRADHLLYMEK